LDLLIPEQIRVKARAFKNLQDISLDIVELRLPPFSVPEGFSSCSCDEKGKMVRFPVIVQIVPSGFAAGIDVDITKLIEPEIRVLPVGII
jgi:hypothetical protein